MIEQLLYLHLGLMIVQHIHLHTSNMLPGQLVALSNTHTQGLQYMVCGYMYVRITNAAKMVDTQYGHCVRYIFWHTCNLCNNLVYSLYT